MNVFPKYFFPLIRKLKILTLLKLLIFKNIQYTVDLFHLPTLMHKSFIH